MSIFDYPRINFAGDISLNPATANNDDYAGGAYLSPEPGSETLALMRRIDEQYLRTPFYGSRRMAAWLRNASPRNFASAPIPECGVPAMPAAASASEL